MSMMSMLLGMVGGDGAQGRYAFGQVIIQSENVAPITAPPSLGDDVQLTVTCSTQISMKLEQYNAGRKRRIKKDNLRINSA